MLKFAFKNGEGALGYLNEKTVSLNKNEIWFLKDFENG